MRKIGFDLGYGGIKVSEAGKESIIASFVATPMKHSEPTDEMAIVEFNGLHLLVGRDVYLHGKEQPSQSPDRWLGSDEALAAFYAGMGMHLKGNRQQEALSLYVGLPASLTAVDIRANTQAKVSKWLVKNHNWKYNGKQVTADVANVVVRSQASGAIFDMIHTMNGEFSRDVEYLDHGVGVLSIGFNTIELSGGMNGKPAAKMMHSADMGVQALLAQLNTNPRFGLSYLDDNLRRKSFGKDYEAKRSNWAKSIINTMTQNWDFIDTLQRIMVVGGGAQYAEPELRHAFGDRLYIPTSPIFSVSRGLYKMAVVDGKSA